MVVAAQQDQIVQVGPTAADPVNDVVGVGPARRSVASGEPAASIAGRQCPALASGDEPVASTDVDRLTIRPEHDSMQSAVADETRQAGVVDDETVTRFRLSHHAVVTDVNDNLRDPGSGPTRYQIDEGVRPSLCRRSDVPWRRRRHRRVESSQQDFTGLGVEPAVDAHHPLPRA